MKIHKMLITVMAALLLFGGDALAERPPGAGNGGGGGGSGSGDDVSETTDYGDLIILYRDEDGVPIPSDVEPVVDPETGATVDGGLCWQPIAFNVEDELLCPAECVVTTTDPFTVSVNQYNCGVTTGCANCTQEVDFGRINEARTPASVFEAQLEDVVIKLANADCTTLDPAGRMVASTVVYNATLESVSTIDHRLAATEPGDLPTTHVGRLPGDVADPITLPASASVLDTAARGLGAASDKGGEVNVDMVAYLNSAHGPGDNVPTILDPKLCETYREEVQGAIQLVEKCYLDYAAYGYDRTTNFGAVTCAGLYPRNTRNTNRRLVRVPRCV